MINPRTDQYLSGNPFQRTEPIPDQLADKLKARFRSTVPELAFGRFWFFPMVRIRAWYAFCPMVPICAWYALSRVVLRRTHSSPWYAFSHVVRFRTRGAHSRAWYAFARAVRICAWYALQPHFEDRAVG